MEATHKLSIGLMSSFLLMLSASSQATIMGYSFDWTGTSNYTMHGMFTYDDADAIDGAIRDSEVASLEFEGFLNNVSIGVNNTAHTLTEFNFNFNTAAGQFFLDGSCGDDCRQAWNYQGSGLGFVAGGSLSALSLLPGGGSFVGSVDNPTPLFAEKDSVPEPTTLTLLGVGLVGLTFARRKMRHNQQELTLQ